MPDRVCRGIPGMCAKLAYGPGLQCVQSSHLVAYEGNYLQIGILVYNICRETYTKKAMSPLLSTIYHLHHTHRIHHPSSRRRRQQSRGRHNSYRDQGRRGHRRPDLTIYLTSRLRRRGYSAGARSRGQTRKPKGLLRAPG